MSQDLKPCPWCGEVPDVSNDAAFRLTDGVKYGALQCCVIGPGVRTDYKDLPHWREKAIRAWNDRKPSSTSTSQGAADSNSPEFDGIRNSGAARGDALDAARFLRCAYPVAPEINPRGYNWCEAWLDELRSAIGTSTSKGRADAS